MIQPIYSAKEKTGANRILWLTQGMIQPIYSDNGKNRS